MEQPANGYVAPSARAMSVWIPNDLIDYTTEIAEETGVSRNAVIVEILQKHRANRKRRLAKKS